MKIENVLLLLYADMEDPDMTPSRQSSLPLPQNNPLSLSLSPSFSSLTLDFFAFDSHPYFSPLFIPNPFCSGKSRPTC